MGRLTTLHFLLCLVTLPHVLAFIPTDLKAAFGFFGTSHETQTKNAIKLIWKAYFGEGAANIPTAAMTRALKEISGANAFVDEDQEKGELHFDGESFTEGQERLVDFANWTIEAVRNNDSIGARKLLGQALHTVQDFYAHSNYLEMQLAAGSKKLVPHPGLGIEGTMFHPLAKTVDTCKPCENSIQCTEGCEKNLLPAGLTSGYYGGEPNYPKPSKFKCSHGGFLDTSSLLFGAPAVYFGQGINKDSKSCKFSPHVDFHDRAAELATVATRLYIINTVTSKITQQQRALLFGTDLGAYSLWNDYPEWWDYVDDFIKLHKREDPTIVHRRATALRKGWHTFVAAKNVHEHGVALARAVARDKFHPLQFVRRDLPENLTDYSGWKDVATETGGHVIKIGENDDIEKTADFLKMLSQPDFAEILSVAGVAQKDAVVDFTFSIDSTLESLLFSTSGVGSFELFYPDGCRYPLDPSANKYVHKRELSDNIAVNITSVPAPGAYKISLRCNGDYTLSISGNSSLFLAGFQFVEIRGRPGHEGAFPIFGSPVTGQSSLVEAYVHGNFTDGAFEFRTKGNEFIVEQSAIKVDTEVLHHGTRFEGESTPIPTDEFMVYMKGVNDKGEEFQRALIHMISPSHVKLSLPKAEAAMLQAGKVATVPVTVLNVAEFDDTYDIFAVDEKDVITHVSQNQMLLKAGETGTFDVTMQPAQDAVVGSNHILVSVKGRRTRGNKAVVRAVIHPEPTVTPDSEITQHYYANETEQLILDMIEQDNQGKLLLGPDDFVWGVEVSAR
ncbi:hypothetical protein Dda_2286 [Drechslerella dactyloides]|uniref:Uncharacterized protein n=1 Tax=Drechslerella dactyloides TaxID=74499 RepID=A0AAD6J7A0_DREDA|nr:hypothetical protein Dda_2286 [Drechslerella dactyloides]